MVFFKVLYLVNAIEFVPKHECNERLLFDAQFMFGRDSKHIAIDFEDNDNDK